MPVVSCVGLFVCVCVEQDLNLSSTVSGLTYEQKISSVDDTSVQKEDLIYCKKRLPSTAHIGDLWGKNY